MDNEKYYTIIRLAKSDIYRAFGYSDDNAPKSLKEFVNSLSDDQMRQIAMQQGTYILEQDVYNVCLRDSIQFFLRNNIALTKKLYKTEARE